MGIYETFEAKVRRISKLESVSALLRWDQETYLPKMGAADRGDQLTLLASIAHEEFVGGEMGSLLASLTEEEAQGRLDPDASVNLREVRRSFEREKKLPAELVEEIAMAHAQGFQAWGEAREAQDFGIFAPCLERNVELQKQVAELFGYKDHPYDAFLDLYEPGVTTQQLAAMFQGLKEHILPVLETVERCQGSDLNGIAGAAPVDRQVELVERIAREMGFDFAAGRVDRSEHPFSTSLSPRDVRVTAHYYHDDPFRAIFTILHEGGHGLYRQGTQWEHRGMPTGDIVSAGVDESQARFWENVVGRSHAFWRYTLPQFKTVFPGIADHLNVDDVYAMVNRVRRSLIRVGADELTYNLHIMLRFEIERDLLGGSCRVEDLPAIWNGKMRTYLGMTPSTVVEGVLQDIHWSDSYFGYFPTYTLGNLYAAQLGRAIHNTIPDMEDHVALGDFRPLREWLREKIHRHGKRLLPTELIEQATGSPPSSDAFVEYVRAKYLRS